MDKDQQRKLIEAIQQARQAHAARGLFDAPGIACAAMIGLALENPEQWAAMRDQLALDAITAAVNRGLRASAASDARQGWLPFPEFEHIPQTVRGDTLEQFRDRAKKLEAKIKSASYPRRSPKQVLGDKRELREMRRLDPKIAPFFANEPAMTVERAAELYRKQLDSPVFRKGKRAIEARWARRTKNQ